MFWKRSVTFVLFVALALFLTGCELSLQTSEVQDIGNVPVTSNEGTDQTAGESGETAVEPAPETSGEAEEPAPTTEESISESPRPETEGEQPAEPSTEEPAPATEEPAPATEESEEPAPSESSSGEGEPAPVVTAEPPATTGETATTEQPAPTTTATADSHTVAAGENLYRIGLRYGVSWVAIAQANNIANPNSIQVGQVLRIPSGDTTADPAPTPIPVPSEGTTYTVRAGDTLARIGQAFGVDWRLIAEANGLINPNRILVGDELKIPANTPGPNPDLTHEVRVGETLFLISLNYGVTWTSIAEANELTAPYVIYPGQILTIPGE